jgi:hypothetical protein
VDQLELADDVRDADVLEDGRQAVGVDAVALNLLPRHGRDGKDMSATRSSTPPSSST